MSSIRLKAIVNKLNKSVIDNKDVLIDIEDLFFERYMEDYSFHGSYYHYIEKVISKSIDNDEDYKPIFNFIINLTDDDMKIDILATKKTKFKGFNFGTFSSDFIHNLSKYEFIKCMSLPNQYKFRDSTINLAFKNHIL